MSKNLRKPTNINQMLGDLDVRVVGDKVYIRNDLMKLWSTAFRLVEYGYDFSNSTIEDGGFYSLSYTHQENHPSVKIEYWSEIANYRPRLVLAYRLKSRPNRPESRWAWYRCAVPIETEYVTGGARVRSIQTVESLDCDDAKLLLEHARDVGKLAEHTFELCWHPFPMKPAD